jgi:hypothetical protein
MSRRTGGGRRVNGLFAIILAFDRGLAGFVRIQVATSFPRAAVVIAVAGALAMNPARRSRRTPPRRRLLNLRPHPRRLRRRIASPANRELANDSSVRRTHQQAWRSSSRRARRHAFWGRPGVMTTPTCGLRTGAAANSNWARPPRRRAGSCDGPGVTESNEPTKLRN